MDGSAPASVDLYWLPLGAGGALGLVRACGRGYEAVAARREHRRRHDLYHSALEVRLAGARFVVESAPAWGSVVRDRGVVGQGPVGLRSLGRSRFFRYELRRWRDGTIPDVDEAVASPVRVSADAGRAGLLLGLVAQFPLATWGRDELGTADMWNSNSLIAWLLARSGHDAAAIRCPRGGRAPGWAAGLVVAARDPRSGCGEPPATPSRPPATGRLHDPCHG